MAFLLNIFKGSFKTVFACFTNRPSPVTVQNGKSLKRASSPRSLTYKKRLFQRRRNHPQHSEKLNIIKQRLRESSVGSMEVLEMIDAVSRLGIDYLLQSEIEEVLHREYIHHQSQNHDDLHFVSLRFRLLRQFGYHVSSDQTFHSFKGEDGKIKQEIISGNIQGLMSLYEASHLSMQGEDILNNAKALCTQLLTTAAAAALENNNNNTSQSKILHTLKNPHHKSLARITAHHLLNELKNQHGWRQHLAGLAELEYDMTQKLYKNEINSVTKWWKEVGLANLPLNNGKYQPLKWYMWTLTALQDPKFSEERIELTKPISFIYIIDDIYDIYGTPHQLSLFTQAVQRWEVDNTDKLPEYMKICLKALFDTTSEICQWIHFTYGWNPEDYLKKGWADLCHAFLEESKWLNSGCLPTSDEYLRIGTITSGVPLILMHVLFLLGERMDDATTLQILKEHYHTIISSTAIILRLSDDLGSSSNQDEGRPDEEKNGSYINCYMNENTNVSIDDAREHTTEMILNEWAILNKHCLMLPHKNSFSSAYYSFARGCLNVARTIPIMYGPNAKQSLQKLIDTLFLQTHT